MNIRNTRSSVALVLSVAAFLFAGGASADPVASVVLMRSTPNPVVQGQSTVIAIGVNPTGIAYPTGTITISDTCSTSVGSVTTTLGSFPLGLANSGDPGAGSLTVTSFPCIGSNQIVAGYTGDANYLPGTSAPLIETVLSQFTPSSTSLASSANPSSTGEAVTFTAEITYTFTNNSHATGTVTFTDINTSTVLGTGTVETIGAGRRLVTLATVTASLSAGTYAVQAAYSGDNIYAPSSSSILNQTVQGSTTEATRTSLDASSTSITLGQSDTFTATVSSGAGTPSGSVNFYDDANLLATLNLDSTGKAILTESSLTEGVHPITAEYSGDSSFAGSTSSPLSITITPVKSAPTTTALNASSNPAPAGSSVSLVAKISSSYSGTLSGTVTFVNDSSTPATTLGTANVQNGVASLNVTFAAGTYSLVATYSGDSNSASSTGVLVEVVNPPSLAPTATQISSSADPSSFGQSVTFTASVTAVSGTPSGSVTFTAANTTAEVALNSTGKAVLTTSALPVGSMNVSAAYSANAKDAGSTSPLLGQTVAPASTTTTLSSSTDPSAPGVGVTFTATVKVDSPGSGTPTGTVAFVADSSDVLCANSTVKADHTAVCSSGPLAVGPHSVHASYTGTGDFSASSGTLTQTVRASGNVELMTRGTGFVYSRATKLFSSTLTATNTNSQSVGAPVRAVFMALPTGVTLANAAGTFNGAPYLTVPGPLAPGQSASFAAQFSDPSLANISYTIYYYSEVF